MDVDASKPRKVEHRLRQDQSVCGDDDHVRRKRGQGLLGSDCTERERLLDVEPIMQGELLDGRLLQVLTPAGWPVSAGVDRAELVAVVKQRGQ